MTTPNPTRSLLAEPRQLAAWALVGYAGLHLALAFLSWLVPADFTTFGTRAAAAGFTSLIEMAMPVLALLIAAGLGGLAPPVPQAKLIATVAVIEYAAILFFGAITYLIGLGGSFLNGMGVLSYVLLGLARIGLAAVAGLVAYGAWARLGGSLSALAGTSVPNPPVPPTPPAA